MPFRPKNDLLFKECFAADGFYFASFITGFRSFFAELATRNPKLLYLPLSPHRLIDQPVGFVVVDEG
jgi:hypothetical protein